MACWAGLVSALRGRRRAAAGEGYHERLLAYEEAAASDRDTIGGLEERVAALEAELAAAAAAREAAERRAVEAEFGMVVAARSQEFHVEELRQKVEEAERKENRIKVLEAIIATMGKLRR